MKRRDMLAALLALGASAGVRSADAQGNKGALRIAILDDASENGRRDLWRTFFGPL